MAEYQSVEELRKAIDSAAFESLDAVGNEVIHLIEESVEENVYKKFSPREYIRTGALGSAETKQAVVQWDKEFKYTLAVFDNTEHYLWNPVTEDIRSEGTRKVGDIVETGRGYLYRTDIPPRPFMQPVDDKLSENTEIVARIVADYVNENT